MARLITREEAALLLDVTPQTISNWVDKEIIHGHIIDRRLMIDKASIEKYFDTLSDLGFMEKRIRYAKRDLELLEAELEKNVTDTRSAVHLLGKGVPSYLLSDIFSCICDVAGSDYLVEREQAVLQKMLDGKDVSDIADEYGLTRTRIIQIASHGIRKLGAMKTFSNLHKEYKQLLFDNANYESVIKSFRNRIRELEHSNNITSSPISEYDHLLGDRGGAFTALMNTTVVDFDLTVRSLNCLKAAGIETLGDLVRRQKTDLLKFRNFGKKSLGEIDDLLEHYHLHFGMDVDAIIAADTEKMMWEKKNNLFK